MQARRVNARSFHGRFPTLEATVCQKATDYSKAHSLLGTPLTCTVRYVSRRQRRSVGRLQSPSWVSGPSPARCCRDVVWMHHVLCMCKNSWQLRRRGQSPEAHLPVTCNVHAAGLLSLSAQRVPRCPPRRCSVRPVSRRVAQARWSSHRGVLSSGVPGG